MGNRQSSLLKGLSTFVQIYKATQHMRIHYIMTYGHKTLGCLSICLNPDNVCTAVDPGLTKHLPEW